MVDNRSAGFFGIGGAFNFKSGDISGTAAKNQDDKMGPGTEYGAIPDKEEEQNQNNEPFIDRSAQLRATLNSLAMMNVANVLNERKRAEFLDRELKSKKDGDKEKEELDEEFLNDFDDENSEDDGEYY
ncbi:MAG: hypothetical protein WCY19_00050 [Candidatus Gastranaerophilaceae bacterium]